GDQEQVERRAIGQPVIGVYARPLRAPYRSRLLGHGDHIDLPGHVAEHLERTEEIQHLEVREEQRTERLGHGSSSATGRYGSPRAAARTSIAHILPSTGIDTVPVLTAERLREGSRAIGGEVVRIHLVTPRNPPSFWTYDHVLPALG